jgi:SAM-dependent methyltransferase
MTSVREGMSLTADKWSKLEPDTGQSFFGFAPLREYLIETAYGPALAAKHKGNRYWAEDILVDEYLRGRRIHDVLSLCCGFGEVERRVVSRLKAVRSCLGVDVAPGALAAARERAAAEGLTAMGYAQADLNHYLWPDATYDLIIANGALHHLAALEEVPAGMARALRPGGVIYANEHVGASRLDHSARQLELINAAAYLVPPELRQRRPIPFGDTRPVPRAINRLFLRSGGAPLWHGSLLDTFARTLFNSKAFRFGSLYSSPATKLARSDPSESVRSSEILRLFRAQFPAAQIRAYGGGLLAYALDERFYEAYDDLNPRHRAVLELLCALERELMAEGELGPEHAILIVTGRARAGRASAAHSRARPSRTTRGAAAQRRRR